MTVSPRAVGEPTLSWGFSLRILAVVGVAASVVLTFILAFSWQRELQQMDRNQREMAERTARLVRSNIVRRVERTRTLLRGISASQTLREALAQRSSVRVATALAEFGGELQAHHLLVLDTSGRPVGWTTPLATYALSGDFSSAASAESEHLALVVGDLSVVVEEPVEAARRPLGLVRSAAQLGRAFLHQASLDLDAPLALILGDRVVHSTFSGPNPSVPANLDAELIVGREMLGEQSFDLVYISLDQKAPGGTRAWVAAGISREEIEAARGRFLGLVTLLGFAGLGSLLFIVGGFLWVAGRRERRLIEQRDAAETLSAGLSDRLAHLTAVVHDIKAPLSGIQLSSENLREEAQNPEIVPVLERIIETCERLSLYLVNILMAAEAEEGPIRTRREVLLLPGLLADVAERVTTLAVTRRVEVCIAAEQDLPPVHGDATLLERALLNLASNAIAACRAGDHVELFAEQRGGELAFGVRDTGPGFPFDPAQAFSRGRPRVKNHSIKAGSSGLGLYIVARIAEAHGARVVAENRPGGGACVKLFMPVKAPAEQSRVG